MANKFFFPPFTPIGVYKNILDKKKINDVNFIIKNLKNNNKNNNKNNVKKKKTFLIMDSGTKSLSNLISNTIPYIMNNSNYNFYIGTESLTAKAKKQVAQSKNLKGISSLKGMYTYISKVDFVITRAGFNSLTECLILKKPAIFMSEKFNPEISENLKFISKLGVGTFMNSKNWEKNFLKRIDFFLRFEENKIKKNLNSNLTNYDVNGSVQIVNLIKKDYL